MTIKVNAPTCTECRPDSFFECDECRATFDAGLPPAVAANLQVLKNAGIWHLMSRNPVVRSCADAASRRKRMGGEGIPLSDELKSSVVRIMAPGEARYAALHTRGHQMLAPGKVEALFGAPVERVGEQELQQFGMGYGTVTPFALARHPEVAQVFDVSVFERYLPPYTMMTNLGHLEYGVEFSPAQFLTAFPASQVEDIAAGERPVRAGAETFGILTGNSPESGMLLWEKLNRNIRESTRVKFRGDVSFPRVLIESVPDMGLSMEVFDRIDEVRRSILTAVQRLCDNGVTTLCVACNTTQYFEAEIGKICAENGVTYVSIVQETANFLRAENVERFDLLAITPVVDFALWSEFDLHVPSQRHLEAMMALGFAVKREVVSPVTLNRLRDLVKQSSKTDTVVIALTELSILVHSQKQKQKSSKRFIDTLDVLARRLAAIHDDDRLAHGVN
jgi:aspartate/glutamate racemase